MRRIIAILLMAPALILAAVAAAQTDPPQKTSCIPARAVYAHKHWRWSHPGNHLEACPSTRIKELKESFFDYRLYRRVATFHAPFGHGRTSPADGRWWAKPWQVICGESRGDFYVNGDGAYQIIPSTWATHGGTRYAATAGGATPLEQHVIAHRAARAGEPWYGWSTDC